jgi:hypothetical protein
LQVFGEPPGKSLQYSATETDSDDLKAQCAYHVS